MTLDTESAISILRGVKEKYEQVDHLEQILHDFLISLVGCN